MLLFIDFCDLWWLAWLLPFLLGLGLGWLLWSKFKSLWADSEAKVASLNSANTKLDADLTSTRNAKADLEGDVALMKGRVREMEAEVTDYKSKLSGLSNVKASDNSDELDRLKSELAAANSRADQAEADAKAAATNTPDTSKLEGEISDLKGKLSECESNSAALKAKADKAAADLAEANMAGGAADGVSALAASGAASLTGNANDGKVEENTPVYKKADTGNGVSKPNPYAKLKSDDLQIIEGIGPKMESVLHENGVKNWSDLSGKSEDDLRAILNKYGDKYRIIDPSSWSAQASKAGAGDWEGLIALQKSLDGGRGNTANNNTDSKLEKRMVKMGLLRRYKQDDLKAVEGIGPKIEQLLHAGGIKTWRELANTDVVKIQGILNDAGNRYKLADPGTWPKQAELAADGKWDELTEYQDFLQGGK